MKMARKKSGAANHIHRYKKVNLSRNPGREPFLVFKCVKPVCTHYIPIHLSEGTMAECNKCHEPFLISKVHLHGSGGGPMAKPICLDCRKRKPIQGVDAIEDFLKEKEL